MTPCSGSRSPSIRPWKMHDAGNEPQDMESSLNAKSGLSSMAIETMSFLEGFDYMCESPEEEETLDTATVAHYHEAADVEPVTTSGITSSPTMTTPTTTVADETGISSSCGTGPSTTKPGVHPSQVPGSEHLNADGRCQGRGQSSGQG